MVPSASYVTVALLLGLKELMPPPPPPRGGERDEDEAPSEARRFWRRDLQGAVYMYLSGLDPLPLFLTHWNAPTNRRAPVQSRERGLRSSRRRTRPRRRLGGLAVELRRLTFCNSSNSQLSTLSTGWVAQGPFFLSSVPPSPSERVQAGGGGAPLEVV